MWDRASFLDACIPTYVVAQYAPACTYIFHADLPPDIEDILDTYRVISCTKELNLHSLLQKGPLEYTEPQDYTFVLPESGPNIKDSEWDVVDLPVRVHRKRGGFMKW